MKKKLLTFIGLIGSIACGAFAFAACGETGDNGGGGGANGSGSGNGGGGHTHESANYEVDGEYHWKTCDDCGTEFSKKKHSLQNDVCIVCGYSTRFTEGLEYSGNRVTGIGTATDTDIIIPACCEGRAITSIDYTAFKDCSGLTSIAIPNSVTSIGDYAFQGCSGLASVKIPDGVTSIGYGVVEGIAYYKNESNWENGVLYIGKHLIEVQESFSGSCSIKKGTLTIAGCAFVDCGGLTSVTIPNSVKSIGYGAFFLCSGLKSITIPDSVTSVGKYAFMECGLNSITIGNGVKSIEEEAFSGCTGLTSITIPDSVTNIAYLAIFCCDGLSNISVAEGNKVYHSQNNCLIQTESKELILGCKNSIIPADGSVTSIGEGAFGGCNGLTSIGIPDSVKNIGDGAFYYCDGLTSINYNGAIEAWKSIEKEFGWDYGTGNYTVYCTDGDLDEKGNVIG